MLLLEFLHLLAGFFLELGGHFLEDREGAPIRGAGPGADEVLRVGRLVEDIKDEGTVVRDLLGNSSPPLRWG